MNILAAQIKGQCRWADRGFVRGARCKRRYIRVQGAKKRDKIRIRCHAAVPFGGTEKETQRHDQDTNEPPPARSEEIRSAFNTPFWPHVLATTSVGQEGLDFHSWCDRLGHWDLCSSPVDLEQREAGCNASVD
ncbi:hypothetical protein ACLGGT_21975 [Roseovarius sp. MS2]